MEPVVLDSRVLVASFLPDDHFHQQALQHIVELESGNSVFHLPTLVWVEVIASVNRQAQRNRMALLSRAEQSLNYWDRSGKIVLYTSIGLAIILIGEGFVSLIKSIIALGG